MTRIVSKADELKTLGARPVRGDLTDPESLEFAMRGARAIVLSAHSLLGRGTEASELVDDEGHRTIIDRAKDTGVEHIIYTSVVGAASNHPIDFWRTKARIEKHLQESGITFTIVRATAFMETHAYLLVGKPVIEGKRVMLFGKGRNPRNFVAAEDVAKVIVGALRIPSLRGTIIEVGGPQNLTTREIVETFERVSGKKAKVGHIPLSVARAMSGVIKPMHPGISRVMKLGVWNETHDQTFDPSSLRTRIPITLTPLDEWARNRITEA
jgi:NADH dehydrogenase